MRFLTVLSLMFLTTGCDLLRSEPPVALEPEDVVLFCDVEEPRRFSQEELDWRAANAPWNLRRDFKTNTTWDRECSGEAVAQ